MQGFTGGLKGLKGAYKGLQEVSRGYRGYVGLQKVTWGVIKRYIWLQGVAKG